MARVEPSFFLKGVNYDEIIRKYTSGGYAQIQSATKKIKIASGGNYLATTYSNDITNAVFTVKDRNNSNMVMVNSNHEAYQIFTKTGDPPTAGICQGCHKHFDHPLMGYPIHHEEQMILTTEDGVSKYKILHSFLTEGAFHSFKCALKHIRAILSRPIVYRDASTVDSERYLKLLYRLMHPGAPPLSLAADASLLKHNQGALELDEWESDKYTYVRTDRVQMVPAKIEYLRLQSNLVK